MVEFHGEDLYEASKDFGLGVFEALKSSPYADPNKLLLTGKRELCLRNSRSRLSGLEPVLQWCLFKSEKSSDIQDEIFKLTTNFDAAQRR